MSDRNATLPHTSRALAPDVSRGLMLLLIAAANVSWFLWGRESALTGAHLVDGSALDKAVQFVMMVTVDGRAYPLFGFLFGYGMVQFVRSRMARGATYPQTRRMLRQRHWWMIVIGALHAALLFLGDIVAAYGIVGLLLVWLFFDRRDKTLWVWVWAITGVWTLFALFGAFGGVMTNLFAPEMAETGAAYTPDIQGMTAGEENYVASIVGRLVMWMTGGITQGLITTVPICILLAWLAARRGVLEDPRAHRRLLRAVAWIGIPVGWLGGLPAALTHIGVIGLPSWTFMGLTTITGAASALGYVAVFALLAARWQEAPSTPVKAIAAVGKRSLTFYLFQSLIFAPLFSAWGLGLGGTAGTALAVGIAVIVWIVSVPIAALLERGGARGPAEAVLRRLTYAGVGKEKTPG